jgi:predicted ATP-grasp superfamily ATP-dependent carboligase
MDKLTLHRAAVAEGIASPATETHGNVLELAGWLEGGPIVVKPRLHWFADQLGHELRVEAGLARSELQLRHLIHRVTRLGGQPVLQRFVAGRLVAYVVLLDEEAGLVAHSQQRAVYTFPEPVGVSARAVTEDVNANVAAGSMRLLRRLGITGLAELQYLVDENGTYHVIDINARFYGSLQLAMSAGADMPSLWAETVIGRRTSRGTAPVVGRPGVRYQWFEGDIRRSAARKSVRGALGCLLYASRAHHSIWSARDPGPAAAHVHELGRRAFRRVSDAT